MSSFSIIEVENQDELADIIILFDAYARSLGIDLAFQGFAEEMANMPGRYSRPHGTLLLARSSDGSAIGCVGLRSLVSAEICEMKRLYITPEGRGNGLGKRLAERVIQKARDVGYRRMRLDTLPNMTSALSLYRKLGFHETAGYYATPLGDTIFLELEL